ncbi:UNVERIFIED_CONTAM: hypothetical protein Slati_2685800 [Sesamum latifolium]|uniref:Uncharacterized protein n=1 Tax=Sesamum latifolium TaxID=2727402 RepID=A0AAW2VZS2_9LAMI
MAVGKNLLSRPRSYKDGPRQPKSDKFYRFHNDYGHTTEECRHLKSEIERLIQNRYLQEYVCWEKARDSSSSADILFGETYDQMQLGDVPFEAVDTSLYGFAGEVVHPRGMISLPLTLGTSLLRKTCLLKFLVVDIPSVYNVILGRPTLNTFRAIISTYHMKIKFPVVWRSWRGPSRCVTSTQMLC